MKNLGWIVAAVLAVALLVSIGSQNPKPALETRRVPDPANPGHTLVLHELPPGTSYEAAEPEPPWVAYQRAEAARDALANVRMSDSTQPPGYSDAQAQANADWARSQQRRQTNALEAQARAQQEQAEAIRAQTRELEEQRLHDTMEAQGLYH